MNPLNVPCLKEAKIDCAILANNHSLDFGYQGLAETIATLNAAGVKTAGAGRDATQAREPAILSGSQTRVLVYACGHASSGVDPRWSAESDRPGINFLSDFSEASLLSTKNDVAVRKRPGDAVVFSIHWGSNWGYEIEEAHRRFAHELVDRAGIDVVYGHSSHHVRGIELYHGKVILYGCGNFIDDYEGISGYEPFRDDLALMYFLQLSTIDASMVSLQITPMQIKHFRLQHAASEDIRWLHQVLTREGETLGAQFVLTSQHLLHLVPQTAETLI